MNLTLQYDILNVIKWYVYASFDTNHDCRVKNSATMTLGYGFVSSFSVKHKLNEKSSTEIELIGLNDDFPSMLWMFLFIMVKGYSVM